MAGWKIGGNGQDAFTVMLDSHVSVFWTKITLTRFHCL